MAEVNEGIGQQEQLSFDPEKAWDADGLDDFVPGEESISRSLRFNVHDIKFFANEVKNPNSYGYRALKDQGSLELSSVTNFDRHSGPYDHIRPVGSLNAYEVKHLDILQERMEARLVGYDPKDGRREFATKSPGIRLISYQDRDGEDIKQIASVEIVLKDPTKVEDSDIPKAEPDPDVRISTPPPLVSSYSRRKRAKYSTRIDSFSFFISF